MFYIFSIFLVLSTFMVVIAQHPVFSAIFLSISFISAAFLLFLLECEFLALLLLVIYLGAILVLFLFAIMILESKRFHLKKNKIKYIPVGFIFSAFIFIPLFLEIDLHFLNKSNLALVYLNVYQNWYNLVDSAFDIQVYGQILYSCYVIQFLISGLILMLVLISVVYLTNIFYKEGVHYQIIFKQLSRHSKFFN